MQVWSTPQSSGASFARPEGLGYPFIGSDVDMDASCICVAGSGVGAEAAEGVSETGGSAAETAVSGGSGSGVAALATDMDKGTTTDGSGRLRSTPARAATEAMALAGSPAPALKDAVPLVAALSAIGVEDPKAAPHKITHATKCRDLITGLPPALGLEAGRLNGTRSGRLLDHDRFVQLQ
jgi:hypothetical protein